MEMSDARFHNLVVRLERTARQAPTLYRARLSLLGVLGYVYIFLMLALALGLTGGLIWAVVQNPAAMLRQVRILIPVGISLGMFCMIVLSALWVSLPPPEGTVLRREQAVPLFQQIDRLRATLKAPRFHEVLLSSEFNCGVMQRPRLGVFGWQKNYLVIGLPLMLTLSPEQFRAVLAHEIGHVSAAHGRFGAWIYRLHMTWEQMFMAFEEQEHSGAYLFVWFFNWYAPLFAAYSFALRRAEEYEADRAAAQAAGPRHAADALLNVELMAAFMNDSAAPGVAVGVRSVVPPFHGRAEPQRLQQWLGELLAMPADPFDTHPSLFDRLRALRQEPRIPEAGTESAAEKLLGHKLTSVVQGLARAPGF